MSSQYEDPKKRPPPINIPPLPLPRPVQAADMVQMNRNGQQQQSARNASISARHGPRNMGSVPLTSPLEQDTARLLHSQSQTVKSHRSAKSTLSNPRPVDQTPASPRKSDHGSTIGSQRGGTTRSRHSERSYHSAAAAQAQLEALDEKTTRGRMEERNEHKLFKMTGQVPPTPIAGTANEGDVFIRTEDLRAQCRAVSEEKQAARDEPAKSPKKKMFGNMQIFKSFSRTPTTTPIPPMPSKAAQVLGTSARKPHKIEVRPIKPALPLKTPPKITPSDTSKSLPGKVVDPHNYARRHHSGSFRHKRTSGRTSPGSKQDSDAENMPPGTNASSESVLPPTPPAKDTPPKLRPATRAQSPLRRAAQYEHLRDIYEASREKAMGLQFPEFALSPSPSNNAIPGYGGASPTKSLPYTAEDYTKLIGGEALQWPYPAEDDSSGQQHGTQSAPLSVGNREALQLPRPDGLSDERQILPRFYSPSLRSYRSFAEGETPSGNTDLNRYLFSVPTVHLLRRSDDSSTGSIQMIYQGDGKDIDPRSSTGQLFSHPDQNMVSPPPRDDSRLATRVMQELHIGDHHEPNPQQSGTLGHLQPDQSSSRLTDMLEGLSPRRTEFNSSFQPKCPSAVPSPLHKMPGALTPSQPRSVLADPGSFGPWGPPRTPKNIDDHFFMTNEHLDVVGKTTWDLLQMFNQQYLTALNIKQDQIVGLVERHIKEVKQQINAGQDKADQASMQNTSIHTNLDNLADFIKQDVTQALAEQSKKATDMEAQMKELQKIVQVLQKSLEQKLSEPTGTAQQPSATGPLPTSNSAHAQLPLPAHRSQSSLAGYYGNTADLGRDGQPPMPQMHDNRSMMSPQDGLNDARAGYNNNHGQQWGTRTGYLGRSSKESDRLAYSGANPYHFANGAQFNNGYAGGYSGYNFSPSPPDQHYAFNQGPAK